MDKEFYDKYGKELDCKSCIGLQECSTNSNIPLCDKGYRRFAKDKIADLETELAEKDKEIEKLKQQYTILENENGKLTTELIMGKYKKAQKEVSFGIQLAIQELEKVKEWLEPKYFDYEQINYLSKIIDQQIKELKGEKDEKL